jgi:hypothetical protein
VTSYATPNRGASPSAGQLYVVFEIPCPDRKRPFVVDRDVARDVRAGIADIRDVSRELEWQRALHVQAPVVDGARLERLKGVDGAWSKKQLRAQQLGQRRPLGRHRIEQRRGLDERQDDVVVVPVEIGAEPSADCHLAVAGNVPREPEPRRRINCASLECRRCAIGHDHPVGDVAAARHQLADVGVVQHLPGQRVSCLTRCTGAGRGAARAHGLEE